MLSNRDVTSRHVNIFEFFTIIGCQDEFSINVENFSSKALLVLKWHTKNQLGYTCTPDASALFLIGMPLKVNLREGLKTRHGL